VPVAVAEFGEDLVVYRVEFFGELLQILLAEAGEWALDGCGHG
jgi:hypothetical protein